MTGKGDGLRCINPQDIQNAAGDRPTDLATLDRDTLSKVAAQFALHLSWELAEQLPDQFCKAIVKALRELHPNSISTAKFEGPFVYLYSAGDLEDTGAVGFCHEMTVDEARAFSGRHGGASVWLVAWDGDENSLASGSSAD